MKIPLKSKFTVNKAVFHEDNSPVADGEEVVIEIRNHGYEDDVLNTNKTTIKIGEQLFTVNSLNWALEQVTKYHKAIEATQKE